MSKRILRNSKPIPSTLIKLSSIEINDNDSFDKLIVCASRFEDSLKKTGAIPNENYDIIDLFNLALEATKIDNLDEIKNTIEGTIIEANREARREYQRVDQKQVTRGYFQSNYRNIR